MKIAELNIIVDAMQTLNRLADRRELPQDKARAAVEALAAVVGCGGVIEDGFDANQKGASTWNELTATK
jgi:hypothetical protein